MNVVRCFGLTTAERFPFVKAIGENEATLVPIAATEGWFFGECFTACIDKAIANLGVFCPHGNQAPDEKISCKFIVVGNSQNGLRGCNVETGCKHCREVIVAKGIL